MFKRWPSIENSYRQKHIAWFLERYPELADETFVITEKLHGSNFQWYFQPGKPVQAGSRNNFLDIAGSFQGAPIPSLMEAHASLLDMMQSWVDKANVTVRLFGELFGQGIQKGVNYGDGKHILYFGLMINDELVPFAELEAMLAPCYLVPIVAKVKGLKAALEFDTKFDSLILGEPDNICEGVVIQPYAKVYTDTDGHGSPFMLKKKNEEFKEKAKAKAPRIVDSEVERLHAEFVSYITDNRLQSVFSKHSEIENSSQIGDYIRWVLADAKEEFLKDFGDDLSALDRKQQKSVYNVGGMIANMLKKYL